MKHVHTLVSSLLSRQINVALIGAGGTGSHMLRELATIHLTMLELGHPGGLHVTVYDLDRVSKTNIGRQDFFPADVGHSKAVILVNRCNLSWGTRWKAIEAYVTESTPLNQDIVISCVDNRRARKGIIEALSRSIVTNSAYYLDIGNKERDGQVILGQVMAPYLEKKEGVIRLPHSGELFPDIVDESLDDKDDTPSCSMAEALTRQSLFINRKMAVEAGNLLNNLLRDGSISYHGAFVNSKTGNVIPLQIDTDAWARMGYKVPAKKKPRSRKKVAVAA